MLTGRYNHLNRVVNNHTPMAVDARTWAAILGENGWRTGYFGKFHMGDQPERPGFAEIASYIGQGRYVDCPFEVDGVTTPTTGWVDDVTTDFALDFIDRHAAERFAMFVGFKSPHVPRTPPARLADRFPGIHNVPAANRTAFVPFDPDPQVYQPTDAELRAYSQVIVGADENLGRILDALDARGLAEDTVVIFVSDNGYFLGDHSRSDKRLAYEESLRIPFVVRYPRRAPAGVHRDAIVLNLDLAPTILGLAGVAIPTRMQGHDLTPLLGDAAATVRDSFLYEYFFERNFDSPTIVGLRREHDVLVTYPGHPRWVQMFDLDGDALELHNLAPRAAQATHLQEMRAALGAAKTATAYVVPPTADTPP
jgi:arylsulfatase A-like enzyme